MRKQLIFLPLIFSFVFGDSCPNGTIEYQSNCYLFNSTETGFAAAEISCASLGGHLASIHDAFTNDMIGEEGQNYFHSSTDSDLWIGANKLYANQKWNWTDGSAFDFSDWKKGEPQNVSGANCAALSMNDGYWTAQDCFKNKSFLCKFSAAPVYPLSYNCSDGWNYFPLTGACYGVNQGGFNGTWMAAENYCADNGANLVSFHSFSEYRYLMSYVYVYWLNLWTGIYSPDSGRDWKYIDGTTADFLKYGKWCSGHPLTNVPGERCVTLEYSYEDCYWDRNCTDVSHTICKKRIF